MAEASAAAGAADGGRACVLWFEIEDLLRHFDHMPNPTGIPRACVEILAVLEDHWRAGGRIKFCRLSLYRGRFEEIGHEALVAAYTHPPGADAPWHALTWLGRPREEILRLMGTLARFPRYVARLTRSLLRDLARPASHWRRFEDNLASGDVIVALGASWINRRYNDTMARLKRERGVRFVQLIHDVIFAVHPEWVEFLAGNCLPWLEKTIATADLILTVSSYSRGDLRRFAAGKGLALPPVEVLPLGTGFKSRGGGAPVRKTPAAFPERFALFVSTIDHRKNHPFLMDVWRGLIERHGADRVPHLVFVGRPGWMVLDFLQFRSQVAACRHLDGKLVLLSNLSDGELREAYRRCLFTVYPSLYEGWGSPVAESLAYGKFCIASNRTSLPEVGGAFADYFDPTDAADAAAKIERVLFEPGYLEKREAMVRERYRTATWADCARHLVNRIETMAAAQAAAPVPQPAPVLEPDGEAEPNWSPG